MSRRARNADIDAFKRSLAFDGIRTFHARWDIHDNHPLGIDDFRGDTRRNFRITAVEDSIGNTVLLLICLKLVKSHNGVRLIINAEDKRTTVAISKSHNGFKESFRLDREINLELNGFCFSDS